MKLPCLTSRSPTLDIGFLPPPLWQQSNDHFSSIASLLPVAWGPYYIRKQTPPNATRMGSCPFPTEPMPMQSRWNGQCGDSEGQTPSRDLKGTIPVPVPCLKGVLRPRVLRLVSPSP